MNNVSRCRFMTCCQRQPTVRRSTLYVVRAEFEEVQFVVNLMDVETCNLKNCLYARACQICAECVQRACVHASERASVRKYGLRAIKFNMKLQIPVEVLRKQSKQAFDRILEPFFFAVVSLPKNDTNCLCSKL